MLIRVILLGVLAMSASSGAEAALPHNANIWDIRLSSQSWRGSCHSSAKDPAFTGPERR
jgi:hypothetical protein